MRHHGPVGGEVLRARHGRPALSVGAVLVRYNRPHELLEDGGAAACGWTKDNTGPEAGGQEGVHVAGKCPGRSFGVVGQHGLCVGGGRRIYGGEQYPTWEFLGLGYTAGTRRARGGGD